MTLKTSTCRDALDLIEGGSLLVEAAELQALPPARVAGLPEGFQGRRLRSDCVLVGYQDRLGTWALRLNGCSIKPRLADMLAARTPA
jgi:hypothetical protein